MIRVVPGRAGGGGRSFRGEKYKPKKEIAYRMCAGRQNQCDAQTEFFVCTSPQPFCLGVAFWWLLVVLPWCVGGGDVMCCDVMWLAAR